MGNITIEADVPAGLNRDSIQLVVWPVEYVSFEPGLVQYYKSKVINGKVKWIIPGGKQMNFTADELFGLVKKGVGIVYFMENGDNIKVHFKNNEPVFSGPGCDKYNLIFAAKKIEKSTYLKDKDSISISDYLHFSKNIDKLIEQKMQLLNGRKTALSKFAYSYLKSIFIIELDNRRAKYLYTISLFNKYNKLGVYQDNRQQFQDSNWIKIYDSTIAKSAFQLIRNSDETCLAGQFMTDMLYNIQLDFARQRNFNLEYLSEPELNIKEAYYYYARKNTVGLAREKFLSFYLSWAIIKHGGGTVSSQTKDCLTDYLSIPGYPAYKSWMKDYVVKSNTLSKGKYAPDFVLTDINGSKVKSTDLRGKIVLMDFWFTGCSGCVAMAPALTKVEEEFKNNDNVVFLSVSVDQNREKWINSIGNKKYTTGEGVNVYTNGMGVNDSIISSYSVSSYPTLFLINPSGAIIHNPLPDPRKDSGQALITTIKKVLAEQQDGPYVLYKDGYVVAKSIAYKNGQKVLITDSVPLNKRNDLKLTVSSDDPSTPFSIKLKDKIEPEASEYSMPSRILAVSDIEGNFDALRKLLNSNNVIDKNYNWTFGNGHLVLVGDFFDRGEQVTECLWLIYSLEEKAKAAGGYVHFILGNHEIMNLNNNLFYVQAKYKLENCNLLNETYADLYNKNSELGRWLRSKNIVEKIGDLLFVHGGIAPEINNYFQSTAQINQMVRPYLSNEQEALKNENIKLLFVEFTSPFWYRHYYKERTGYVGVSGKMIIDKASSGQIDSTLSKFGVTKIITGHTLINEGMQITSSFANKIINLDTEHAMGHSEALFIESNNFYRVDSKGQKITLFNNNAISGLGKRQ